MARKIYSSVLLLLVLFCLIGPWLTSHSPVSGNLTSRLEQPSAGHWMGTDELGRDLMVRAMVGGRISLLVALATVILSAGFGVLLGVLCGLQGGWLDEVVMRLSDILLAFPGMLLALALMAVLPRTPATLVGVLCITGWVGYARLSRGLALKERELDYVEAARALGAHQSDLVWRHILPNIRGPLLVQASLGTAGVLLTEAGLSFLGLGIQPPHPSWGAMLRSGTDHLIDAPHLAVWPGIFIAVMVLILNGLGEDRQ